MAEPDPNFVVHLDVGDSPILETEFVGTSISIGGKGKLATEDLERLRTETPSGRFFSRERGDLPCTVTPDRWRSDNLSAGEVTKPGGPVVLRRAFVVESVRPGAVVA